MKTKDASSIPDAAAILHDFVFSRSDYSIVKISEPAPVTIEKYYYHLTLHNQFSSVVPLREEPELAFEVLPNVKTVAAQDVGFGSRMYIYKITSLKKI